MGEPRQPNGSKSPSSQAWEGHASQIIGALALAFLGLGTVFYRAFEDWSWTDSFYFSAVTLTTVGYGDLSPTTRGTKLFTVFYIFSGISLIGLWLNEWLKRHARLVERRMDRD